VEHQQCPTLWAGYSSFSPILGKCVHNFKVISTLAYSASVYAKKKKVYSTMEGVQLFGNRFIGSFSKLDSFIIVNICSATLKRSNLHNVLEYQYMGAMSIKHCFISLLTLFVKETVSQL
jgi:hypothetical protein